MSNFLQHDLIFLTYDFQFKKAPVKPIFCRDFKNINYEELECAIFTVDWNILYKMPPVDDQVLFLQNNLSNLFNNHVPLKRLIINKDRPWFNANIKKSIEERDAAYNRWKRLTNK